MTVPDYHIYFDSPTPIFKARVNLASATYPATVIPFDGVSLGAFGDIIPDMTLTLGTTEGARDLGIVRVQNLADADSIPIGRISRGTEFGTLDIQDNAYITVLDEYLPWAKIPRMVLDPDEEEEEITAYKDSDVPVGDYNVDLPPVSNSGPFFADYIDSVTGLITVTFPMNGVDISYAMAEGATIASHDWDVNDGTITIGTVASASITATFPAGKRWVYHTVVDSNGTPHTSRTFVLAVDPDDDVTYQDWANANFTLTQQGQVLEVELNAPLDRATYPDGCLVLVWKGAPASPGDRSHMKFVGWNRQESWGLSSSKKGLKRSTNLRCLDLAECLDILPGFPQALERPEEDDDPAWEFMPDLDMNKMLWYLPYWHCTAVNFADLILPEDGDLYTAMRLDAVGSTIYDQMNSMSRKMVPRHILCCTPQGQLVFQKEWMEEDTGDRPATGHILIEDDYSELQANYNSFPTVHVLNTGAVVATEDWIEIGGEKTLPLAFSRAPGEVFGQGTSEQVDGQNLTLSQEDLNKVTGHRYARLNARYKPFPITIVKNFDPWEIAPSFFTRVQLNVDSIYHAQRELDFESAQGLVQSLNIRLQNNKKGVATQVSLNWEREVSGFPAATHIPDIEREPDPDDVVVPEPGITDPPPMFGNANQVAGIGIDGYVYRTSDFQDATPTWDRVDTTIADTIYSWVVDPFSPGYLSGVGFINGWIACDDGIYRVEDLFGSCTTTLVHSFLEATVGANFHWRQISASFGAFFGEGANPWLMCVSYYGDTTGHEGTWATYSTDGGATWNDEVEISAYYDLAARTRFMPIGLYLSPKTPGLAYTVAYTEPVAGGPLPRFGTSNGGASFTMGPTAASFAITHSYTAPPTGQSQKWLMIGPPNNAVRIKFVGAWFATLSNGTVPSAGGGSMDFNDGHTTQITTTINTLSYTPPGLGSFSAGDFEMEFTRIGGSEWPAFSTTITPTSETGSRIKIQPAAQAGGSDTIVNLIQLAVTITEIELSTGQIYNPSESATKLYKTTDWGATWAEVSGFIEPEAGLGGTIHLPWPDNATEQIALYGSFAQSAVREFRTIKVQGLTPTDISPTDAGVTYGVNRGPFGVRTFDGAGGQEFVLIAGIGNESSLDPSDDKHAVFISDDGGVTSTLIEGPIADSAAPTNRPGYEAAFGGESEQEVFIWGPPGTIKYSVDFGANVLDKSGNLTALGETQGFIGIAGGPA